MSSIGQPIKRLAQLLQSGAAKPNLVPSRLAPSAVYDIDYRIAVIAITFIAFATRSAGQHARIAGPRLKLLQFITLRPWLLPAIREWSSSRGQTAFGFAHSMRIRRAFLSDTAYDDLVDFLVATGIFVREESHLGSGPHFDRLTKIAMVITSQHLFKPEREIIDELKGVKLTSNMLEGW